MVRISTFNLIRCISGIISILWIDMFPRLFEGLRKLDALVYEKRAKE